MSRGIRSQATTAYSDARQRLPLEWVRQCFGKLAEAWLVFGRGPSAELPVELLDGSTQRLRPSTMTAICSGFSGMPTGRPPVAPCLLQQVLPAIA